MINLDMTEPDAKYSFTLDRQRILDALAPRVSCFRGVTASKPRVIGIGTALREIQSNLYAEKIAELRRLFVSDKTAYSEQKKSLPAFTFSGEFSGRNKDSLVQASGFLVLDFDHLENVESAFNKLTADPHTWFIFRSPSGAGLKVGFHTVGISSDEDHQRFFRSASNYIEHTHGLVTDPSGKDISRLCFVSHDPLLFVGDSPVDFDVEKWLPVERQARVYRHPAAVGDKSDSTRRRYAQKVLETACQRISTAPMGERNRTRIVQARVVAGYVASGCLPEDEALAALIGAAESNTDSPEQAQRDIEGAFADGLKCPIEPELTKAQRNDSGTMDESPEASADEIPDSEIRKCLSQNQAGDARLFRRLFAGKYIFDHSEGAWYVWKGHYYEPDRTQHIINDFSSVVTAYSKTLKKVSDEINAAAQERRKDPKSEVLEKGLRRRIEQLQTFGRVTDVLNFVRSFPDMATDGSRWDDNPMLFCCKNGVVDLRHGKFKGGQARDMCKLHSDVEFDVSARCPEWIKFLSDVFSRNKELIAFIRRLCGYFLTADAREEVFPILYGVGANGKSKFVEIIKCLLGEYSGTLSISSLVKSRADLSPGGARADLAKLEKKRLVSASESEDGHKLDLGFVKSTTGRDKMNARKPFDRYEKEFQQTHKLVLLTNYKPKIPPNDFATWRRIALVPFNTIFTERPERPNEKLRDNLIFEKLKAELPGILNWCIEGCLEWQECGLNPPDIVRESTVAYQRENDSLTDFITECCDLSGECQMKVLFDSYVEFCEQAGKTHINLNQFSEQVSSKFDRYTKRHKRFIVGLSLKEN